jgi:hypothetical protein
VVEETTPTNLPSSRSPDVDTPNGRTPDVDTPNTRPKTPDVDTPNGITPEIDTPNARTPNVDTPNPARVEPEAPAPRNADGTADISNAKAESVPARDSSVSDSGRIESDQLSDRQIKNEADYVKAHPEIVEGTAPHRRAKIGEHEWREQPNGAWCRHSNASICVRNFDQTRAKMTPDHKNSPVRQIDETDDAYQQRLKSLKDDLNNRDPATPDEMDNIVAQLDEIDQRLESLQARRSASEASLRQRSKNEDWHGDDEVSWVNPVDPAKPLNPTNMSDADINTLLNELEGNERSDIKRRIQWLQREKTYRETQKDIAKSKGAYEALVDGTKTLDAADRELVVDAITNGRKVLWVKSRQQAERIFHTLDEMANDGSVITRRPAVPNTPGGRPDLPFRGPEWHPEPDPGANRSIHFNAHYVYEGQSVNLHIYWPTE